MDLGCQRDSFLTEVSPIHTGDTGESVIILPGGGERNKKRFLTEEKSLK